MNSKYHRSYSDEQRGDADALSDLYADDFSGDARRALRSLRIDYTDTRKFAEWRVTFYESLDSLLPLSAALIAESTTFDLRRIVVTYRKLRS